MDSLVKRHSGEEVPLHCSLIHTCNFIYKSHAVLGSCPAGELLGLVGCGINHVDHKAVMGQ